MNEIKKEEIIPLGRRKDVSGFIITDTARELMRQQAEETERLRNELRGNPTKEPWEE